MSGGNKFVYGGGVISSQVLGSSLDGMWDELRSGALRREALAEGIAEADLDTLLKRNRTEVIEVEGEGRGLEPITTAIIVKVLIPVGGKVAIDLWTKVLLPYIEAKVGKKLPPSKD